MTKAKSGSTRSVRRPNRRKKPKNLTLSAAALAAVPSLCRERGVSTLTALVELLVTEEKIRVEGRGGRNG